MIGGIVGVALVVLVVAAAVVVRRRGNDDEHSVQHYHRQLHTLEEIREHQDAMATTPAADTGAEGGSAGAGAGGGSAGTRYPASAVRVSGPSTVRVGEPGRPAVPPLPTVPGPSEPIVFDDTRPEHVRRTFMTGSEDPAMHSINHRPRRLGAPLAAIGAVMVLIVVLIVSGLHSSPPARKARSGSTVTAPRAHHAATPHPSTGRSHGGTTTTTTSTAPPAVSAPGAVSTNAATYQVAGQSYSLAVAATTGPCWVQVTNTATGAVLFSATLSPGQRQVVTAAGAVAVIAGATGAFAAAVDGVLVALPTGAQAPFTLTFQPPPAG